MKNPNVRIFILIIDSDFLKNRPEISLLIVGRVKFSLYGSVDIFQLKFYFIIIISPHQGWHYELKFMPMAGMKNINCFFLKSFSVKYDKLLIIMEC